jgi:hypothetical protein
MTARSIRRVAWLTAAGLALAAAPAGATEGPPGVGQPLPDTLQPVTIPQTPNPQALGPGAGSTPIRAKRAKRPRITNVRMTRRVHRHGHPHLSMRLATQGTVRLVIQRVGGKKTKRVWSRTVTVRRTSLSVHLPGALRSGHYRVTVVALDAEGQRSRPVKRTLVVLGH